MNSECDFVISGPQVPFCLDSKSMGEYLFSRIEDDNSELCQIDEKSGKKMTFSELKKRAICVAIALKNRGFGVDDVILACCTGNVDFTSILLGTWFAGAVFAPVDPSLKTAESLHFINLYQPKLIFCEEENIAIIQAAVNKSDIAIEIVVTHSTNSDNLGKRGRHDFSKTNIKSLHEFIGGCPINKISTFVPTPIKDVNESLCLIMASSGTTGFPKGVMETNAGYRKAVTICSNRDIFPVYNSLLLSSNPFWITGMMTVVLSLKFTTTLILLNKPTVEEILVNAEKYKTSYIFLSPAALVSMAKQPLKRKFDLTHLQKILTGGGPLAKTSLNAVRQNLGVNVLEVYGTTEISYFCSNTPGRKILNNTPKDGMSLMRGSKTKIIDPNTGKNLGPNKEGEICCWSPGIMKGYIKNPEATRNSVDEGGWFHTGDIGYYNKEGELLITDRLKDLIKYRGYHVAPAELETLLLSHPEVKEAGVIGIPNDEDGEHPLAFVVRRENTQVSERQLLDLVEENLSSNKWLRGGIKFIDDLPKTSNGKTSRKDLRKII